MCSFGQSTLQAVPFYRIFSHNVGLGFSFIPAALTKNATVIVCFDCFPPLHPFPNPLLGKALQKKFSFWFWEPLFPWIYRASLHVPWFTTHSKFLYVVSFLPFACIATHSILCFSNRSAISLAFAISSGPLCFELARTYHSYNTLLTSSNSEIRRTLLFPEAFDWYSDIMDSLSISYLGSSTSKMFSKGSMAHSIVLSIITSTFCFRIRYHFFFMLLVAILP